MNAIYSCLTLWCGPGTSAGRIAAALLMAHLAGDFVFQSDAMAKNKRRMNPLLNHAATHALLAYVAVGCWAGWGIPLAVFVGHAAVDYVKARAPRSQRVFWVDQAVHLVVLVAIAFGAAVAKYESAWVNFFDRDWTSLCLLVAGAILCVRVLAIVIGFWVEPYLNEIKAAGEDGFASGASRGLTNGGRTIGQWERALIFLLVLVGQPAGIGFLIAAKSIFRFGELMDRRNRMEAEYITVGTLMSFGMAIAISFGTMALVRL